ncbi:hypothetical protein WAI453_007861 [Rhynchosporium graminicola]
MESPSMRNCARNIGCNRLPSSAALGSLQHEKDYIYSLKQNDGKRKSPVNHVDPLILIDETDQFIPDKQIPRSLNLICLTASIDRGAKAHSIVRRWPDQYK